MRLLDWVFPKKCVGCGRVGGYVCRDCEVGMWEEEQICPVCRRLSRYGLRHKYCQKPWTMEGLTCLWAYDGLTRRLIGQSKYQGYYDYLREFSITNYQFSIRPELTYFWEFLETKPIIVPVPLHPNRQKIRGFNQAEVIAKIVGRQWALGTSNLLIRTKDTGQQVGRNKNERLEEMEGAFTLNSNYQLPITKQAPNQNIKFSNTILLIDDVWTTGATMSECAKVLRKGMPVGSQVWGLVLAR